MKKISKFTNCYPISKTLRFELIPQGNTEENMKEKGLISQDEHRAESYVKVKEIIDEYHRFFIEEVLTRCDLDISEYADIYYKNNRSDEENEKIVFLEDEYRLIISKSFKEHRLYKKLFEKELIREILPEFVGENNEKQELINEFYDFTTYFTGFYQNRENMYTDKAQTTGIANRCINENLPKYLDNSKTYEKVKAKLKTKIRELNSNMKDICNNVDSVFAVKTFSEKLSQTGIDMYNTVIGGYVDEKGNKIQGLNEIINLYNQQVERKEKIPFLKPLYKQILSEGEKISFVPEMFESDQELLDTLNVFFNDKESGLLSNLNFLKKLFNEFEIYAMDKIFVAQGADISNISNEVFGAWNHISEAWNKQYDEVKGYKDTEKYIEKRKQEFKKVISFSIAELELLGSISLGKKDENKTERCVAEYIKKLILTRIQEVEISYSNAKELLTSEYKNKKKLSMNEDAVGIIKRVLDNVKALERAMKIVEGSGKEAEKDEDFYGQFYIFLDKTLSIDRIYDKVRNYLTAKPYSKEKFKLNFENPQLLGGWDRNKETDYRCVLLKQNNKYFLAIMDKTNNKIFEDYPFKKGKDYFEKMEYKLLPGPNKMLPKVFFAKKNIEYYNPSNEIIDIKENETFKKGPKFNIKDCYKLIDFYKESINKNEDWISFNFNFSNTKEYEDISAFYREVKDQGYSLRFKPVSEDYIKELVETGELYLFQIYNKDFSEHSKGNPNLHTMYFKMLFDQKNLKHPIFKLSGEAEMFYRKASINDEEKIIHPAKGKIGNKNPLNPKKESKFNYDIIKDRRFTKDKYFLHLPIEMNFISGNINNINEMVRKSIKDAKETYVIGIDRGERNLIYICVIDSLGKIVEQISLNEIVNEYNHISHKIDYHELLDSKEKERLEARQEWKTIQNIKELKEGYISQVVHKICELVVKYDAIIALEDLNYGFKRGRFKVEKQVYQKFENMLISKLNFLASKQIDANKEGGLLHAYQLTNKVGDTFKSKQDGFVFYVPAWLTSKIDPTTGFVNLFDFRYKSVDDAKAVIRRFKRILYNKKENLFEFEFDYSDFPGTALSARKKWILYSNGTRIRTFRNKSKNNNWDNEEVILTDEFKQLFAENNIDINCDNLIEQICEKNSKDFFEKLLHIMKLVVQMRNSITNNTEVDYLISPVKNKKGEFYDSRNYHGIDAALPIDADANGAYNIARKGLWIVNLLKNTPDKDLKKIKISISNAEWLDWAQHE